MECQFVLDKNSDDYFMYSMLVFAPHALNWQDREESHRECMDR